MGVDSSGPPPADAYGRVSNSGRYRVLQEAARSLIDDLTRRYLVNRVDDTDADPIAARSWAGSPATTLVPENGGAPITFTFTAFPGVVIAFGHDGHEAFPACGCDACNEDPRHEVHRMNDLITDIVNGGLVEGVEPLVLGKDIYEQRWARTSGGVTRRRGPLRSDWDSPVPAGTTDWPAWRAAPQQRD